VKGSVAIATLGCKTNQFESAAIAEQLTGAGWNVVPFEAGADLVVINTCTVTSATDSQSRNLIRRARRLRPACRVVVTGCYAQVDPQALAAIPGVSLVLGNEEKRDLLRLLETGGDGVQVGDIRRAATAEVATLGSFAERSRAFVQIQNGCDAFCTYCIIPYARGRSRSVPLTQVVTQVRELAAAGFPELVLTGIHIGQYGADLAPPSTLFGLLQQLLTEALRPRLRLGSIEPTELPQGLLDLVAESSAICPHLHIPLQAGSDSVLRRMNRHYDTAFVRALLSRVAGTIADVAIGLDVIAGFPGESEAEFEQTCALLCELPISHLHVFPFSRRPGTPAATMPGQVAATVIKERAARLREIGDAKAAAFAGRFIGRELEVVVEGGGEGEQRRGLTGNYLTIRFSGPASLVGGTARVRVTAVVGAEPQGVLT